MAKPTSSDGLDPDLLRRVREFQVQVRRPARRVEAVVPARGPLSGREAGILARLRKQSPLLANSMEQALRDLNDHTRLSYVGPAGEVREVMRATVQLLAPDDEVRKQAWFIGVKQGGKHNPSQAERTRYAVQQRRGSKDQVKDVDALIDSLVGEIGRRTYTVGSGKFHAGTNQEAVSKLAGWVWAILDEVLPA
jgi:Predicted pPIWI-associating nuclease